MIERAIRKRWPIDEDKKPQLLARQIRIAISKKSSPREATSAFKAILAAEAQNMEQERRDLEIPEHHTLRIEHISDEELEHIASGGSDGTVEAEADAIGPNNAVFSADSDAETG